MKNYTIIFNEKTAPQTKPSYDRSPTHLHRGIISSPNNSGNTNVNSKSSNNLNVANNSTGTLTNNNMNQKINKAASSSLNVPPRVQSFSTLARERVGTTATRLSSSENKTNEKKKDLAESTEFSKLKLSNYRSKPLQLTSLELKPTTVEVYFRSSSGKSKKIERKAIPTTIFSPPKIGVKL